MQFSFKTGDKVLWVPTQMRGVVTQYLGKKALFASRESPTQDRFYQVKFPHSVKVLSHEVLMPAGLSSRCRNRHHKECKACICWCHGELQYDFN